ncbi:MAG: DNA translocase FtsK 4TM domain-containing protein [Bacteroidota bacterium]|nr:DNA translocase FtsK 4TM domain-containing protein [Bacteroidota bacterium]
MAKKKKSNRNKLQVLLGFVLLFISIILIISFISYFFNWKADQSNISEILDRSVKAENYLGKIGASLSHFFIYKMFGIASFIIPIILSITSYYLLLEKKLFQLISNWSWAIVYMLWISIFTGFIQNISNVPSGKVGYEINMFLIDYIGNIGIALLLIFSGLSFIVIKLNITPKKSIDFINNFFKTKQLVQDEELSEPENVDNDFIDNSTDEISIEIQDEIPPEIEDAIVEAKHNTNTNFFDPKLDLSNYNKPNFDLLNDYGDGTIKIDQDELDSNKNKIVDTLKNYNIGIKQIKATIGPTVTLYEIIPDAGIRISKIKSLEDDIALSLSALGIRIIAPIPGKGTIGIEVPNQKKSIVSMKSLLSSKKFIEAEMELPIAIGKTISNESFVVDLTKMPHLLMAGATGQGKSVGINAILCSILYKKHPAEVKFVLVDPKKIELSIYNKIEKHYLAKLPDSDNAIIINNDKVINTLNSLCREMDKRYELLKNAMTRNIKEYNSKFISKTLNPEEGHMFLPYIVLVIDEFADLIMTSGKEIETPLARLAQLSRAVGIHLVIATQRPSVNVITGLIKANFPARIAYRVTSKIDSRTILDTGGAEQLIGRGDLLYSQSNTLTRIQCGFIDTPEVEKISEFIGSQIGYSSAYELPEFSKDENLNSESISGERDPMFNEAARVIVSHQQGSASLLQRKLKLGYNRAGRIIDQMEEAGIVGPFEGSKARQVFVSDLNSLENILSD